MFPQCVLVSFICMAVKKNANLISKKSRQVVYRRVILWDCCHFMFSLAVLMLARISSLLTVLAVQSLAIIALSITLFSSVISGRHCFKGYSVLSGVNFFLIKFLDKGVQFPL